MKTKTLLPATEGAIWGRSVDPQAGDWTGASARSLLQLDFKPADRQRMAELAEKASAETLTAPERREVPFSQGTKKFRLFTITSTSSRPYPKSGCTSLADVPVALSRLSAAR